MVKFLDKLAGAGGGMVGNYWRASRKKKTKERSRSRNRGASVWVENSLIQDNW